VPLEHDERRIALADLEALQRAVLEDQERTALALYHDAVVGDDAVALLGIAPVINENADQAPAGLPFPHEDRQSDVERLEAAGLQDVGDNVSGYFSVPLFQPSQ